MITAPAAPSGFVRTNFTTASPSGELRRQGVPTPSRGSSATLVAIGYRYRMRGSNHA